MRLIYEPRHRRRAYLKSSKRTNEFQSELEYVDWSSKFIREGATETEMTWIIHEAGQKDTVQDVLGPGENDNTGQTAAINVPQRPPTLTVRQLRSLCHDGWGHIGFHKQLVTQPLYSSFGWLPRRRLVTNFHPRPSRPLTFTAKTAQNSSTYKQEYMLFHVLHCRLLVKSSTQ